MTQESTGIALALAIDNFRYEQSFYISIADRFTDILLFKYIAEAGNRHAQALLQQCQRLELPERIEHLPATPAPVPASLAHAISAAIEMETGSVDLYRRLLTMTDDAQVQAVFDRRCRAAIECRIPSLTRVASGQIDICCGTRRGHSRGAGGRCRQGWRQHAPQRGDGPGVTGQG